MDTQLTATDSAHLRRALELAERGRGRVSPNPLVGAVIVRDGEVIGEGFHAELGGLHAERAALADCRARGEDPAGATIYVSLEPCAHHGRQPPCVEAILEAGIGRVVIASDDPSEKACGRGPGMLRDGGVEVAFAGGAEASAARLLNQPFRKHARTGLPLAILKLAVGADGRTATPPGASPWISGERSRELVHRWRAESDAIAVGIGTVLADDPLLTARLPGARQPLRVVFDSEARLPCGSQLLATLGTSPLLVVVAPDADPARTGALRDVGAEVIVAAGATPAERVTVALAELGRRGLTSLFLEGGETLAAAFVAADQVDEARIFFAPGRRDEGAAPGSESFTGSWPSPPAPLDSATEQVGEDTLVTTRFKEW
ncbi:MAG: bifunctional diaminohydroxyphosphoribosylaminopyrimidine deaminase/5-amino-6-(5-phosphoribosylamino)uracil reductase RibD [Solirubrobacterales bacterium]